MFCLLESVHFETTQLCDEIHQRRCCASLLLVNHQGSQFLPGRPRLAHHLDELKQVIQPLSGEAWGHCPVPTPAAPCLHPTIQEPVLSHEQILAPARVHPILLMPVIQKNQLLVWELLHLSSCDVPPAESATATLPSDVGVALVISGVSPLAHATPYLFLPFSYDPSAFTWFTCHAATSYVE